jgi:hypothetical protein
MWWLAGNVARDVDGEKECAREGANARTGGGRCPVARNVVRVILAREARRQTDNAQWRFSGHTFRAFAPSRAYSFSALAKGTAPAW